jgi:HEAT repeat protein
VAARVLAGKLLPYELGGGRPDIVAGMADLATSKAPLAVRQVALMVMGSFGGSSAVELACKFLAEPEMESTALRVLIDRARAGKDARIGDAVAAYLEGRHVAADVRAAFVILEELNDPRAPKLGLRLLTSGAAGVDCTMHRYLETQEQEKHNVCAAAAMAVSRCNRNAREELVALLKHREACVRAAALQGIRFLLNVDAELLPLVAALKKDASEEVRRQVGFTTEAIKDEIKRPSMKPTKNEEESINEQFEAALRLGQQLAGGARERARRFWET